MIELINLQYFCKTTLKIIRFQYKKGFFMLKNVFFTYILFFVFSNVFAQNLANKKYEVQELQEDFEMMVSALQEAHPALYEYISQEDWKENVEETKNLLDKAMTEIEFYNTIKPLIFKIKDGHTALLLSEESDELLKTSIRLFPLDLEFVDKKALVTKNYSENPIPIGAEILEIQQQKINEILPKMVQREAVDGNIRTATYWRLSQGLFGFEWFYLFGETREFEVKYLPKGENNPQKSILKAVSFRKKTELQSDSLTKRLENPFHLQFLENQTAVLTLDIISDLPDEKTPFVHFIKESFEKIKINKSKNLILDLRNNGVGDDVYGAFLYSFLTDSAFKYYDKQAIKQRKYSFIKDTDDQSINRLVSNHHKKELDDGSFEISLDGLEKTQKPSKNAFLGNLYVLINGGTFGTASEVASLIQFHKKGKIVGEESGSTFHATSSGFIPYLKLRHSKLQLTIPLVRYHLAVSQENLEGKGVLPDWEISKKIEDILQNKDSVLEYILEKIK